MNARWWRALVWAGAAALVAGAVVWRAVAVRDAVYDEVRHNFAVTTRALLVTVSGWWQTRVAHAEAVAGLLADDEGFAPGPRGQSAPSRARLAARFTRGVSALARRGEFDDGWLLDADGYVVAWSGPAAGPAGDRAGAPDSAAAGDPLGPGRVPDSARPTVAITTVPCGPGYCVQFVAPVHGRAGRIGAVVLRATVDDSTFRPLNPMRARVRTGRTSVLARLPARPWSAPADGDRGHPADRLGVVASVGAPGSPPPRRVVPLAAAPTQVRGALGAGAAAAAPAPGAPVTGFGRGLHGRPSVYAVATVPELDWVLLREIERAELHAWVREGLLVEEPILLALLASAVLLARNRLRAGRARREQELTRLRADFVAGTSHELRTPLAQIRMFAELLQKGALRDPGEAARALRIIEKEASRLTILVDNLLNYTRMRRRVDAPAGAEPPASADVADEVGHVLDAFAPLAAERGVRVVAAVAPGLRAQLDSLALRQVLTNFLENAVKYGPPGQTVSVGAAARGARVQVWVDDEGPGVPTAERDAVWTAFRRGAHAEASGQGGSGIGLAVVRELVLQAGGRVLVGDAPSGGARFVAELPAGAPGAPGAAPPTGLTAGVLGRGPRVVTRSH